MNPAILETLKVLAGVANAERIDKPNKQEAEDIISKILEIVDKDVDEYKRATSTLLNP